MKKGQLLQVTYRNFEKAWWYYGVVVNIFDDRCELKLDNGHKFMFVYEDNSDSESELLKDQEVKTRVVKLLKDEKPVILKKKLFGFGSYEFPKSR